MCIKLPSRIITKKNKYSDIEDSPYLDDRNFLLISIYPRILSYITKRIYAVRYHRTSTDNNNFVEMGRARSTVKKGPLERKSKAAR